MFTLNDPDPPNSITNTLHDNIKNIGMKYNFLRYMSYIFFMEKKSQIDISSLSVYFNPNQEVD